MSGLKTISEIQTILNNRPLCEPTDDDFDFLTPNSILFGSRLESHNDNATINEVLDEVPVSCNKRMKYLNASIDYFWKIWKREYLTSLRDIHARINHKKGGKLDVNDLVIVQDEKLPRHRWKLGKVIELVHGKDKILRGARIILGKTKAIISRPLNKLCRLELFEN